MARVCPIISLTQYNDRTGNSFAVAAYVTSYISKPDKFMKIGWRDILRELDTQIESIPAANKGK